MPAIADPRLIHSGWTIVQISRDDDFLVELAALSETKWMLVVTKDRHAPRRPGILTLA